MSEETKNEAIKEEPTNIEDIVGEVIEPHVEKIVEDVVEEKKEEVKADEAAAYAAYRETSFSGGNEYYLWRISQGK